MREHPGSAELIGLELGLLDEGEQNGVQAHLDRCIGCRSRREAVREELAAFGSELQDRNDERAHVPAALLLEYAAGSSGIGADIARAIETHMDGCPQCSDEMGRIDRAQQASWAKGVVAGRSRTRTPVSQLLSDLLRRPAVVIGAVAVAGVLVIVPLRLVQSEHPPVSGGFPVRLLGAARGSSTAPTEVRISGETALVLLLRTAAPIDSGAEYEILLRQAGGAVLRRVLPGATFDRSGATAILVGSGEFRADSPVIVTMTRIQEPERRLFEDAFVIRH